MSLDIARYPLGVEKITPVVIYFNNNKEKDLTHQLEKEPQTLWVYEGFPKASGKIFRAC